MEHNQTRDCQTCGEAFEPMEPRTQTETRCPTCQAEYRKDRAGWKHYENQLAAQSAE